MAAFTDAAVDGAFLYDLNDDDESEDDDGLGFDAKQDDGGFSPERNKVFVSRGGR